MLKAGFASLDITPDTRHSLMGYDFRWTDLPPGNDGVHDPLLARAIILHDGTAPAAIVNLELCVLEVDLARAIRAEVAAKLGTTADRVIVSTIHTHSGPFPQLRDTSAKEPDAAAAARRKLNEEYADFLRPRIIDAVSRAAGLLYPVSVRAIAAPLGIGYTRRVRTAEGVRHCWNPLEFPELVPDPSPDPACTAIILRQPHGPRTSILWGVGVHPVGLGKTSRVVSADWPGLACRMIDQAVPGAHSAFFLGAAGEVHPLIATQEDPGQLEPVAAAAASMVKLLVASGAGHCDDDAPLRIAARTWKCGKLELDLAAWRIGPALLLAAPVELFASLSRELRSRIPGPILLATVTNGWTGYWPDCPAFAEGKYEVNASWSLQPGDGEKLIDELVSLAEAVGQ